jgi:hypothetical protein
LIRASALGGSGVRKYPYVCGSRAGGLQLLDIRVLEFLVPPDGEQ